MPFSRLRGISTAVVRITFALGLAVLLLAGVNPVEAQTAAPESRPFGETDLFRDAEFHFHAGRFAEAKSLYHDFVTQKPHNKWSARALYRLGQIDQKEESYATALRFYQMLLERFPGTEMAPDVHMNMGLCYFELAQYPDADQNFRTVLKTHPNRAVRWKALYQLARVDEEKFDYTGAIAKLNNVYEQNEDGAIRTSARQLIESIIDEKLSEAEVHILKDNYGAQFPGDLLLKKLLSLYRNQRDIYKYQNALKDLARLYPQHPERPRFEAYWKQVTDNPELRLRIGAVVPLSGKLAVTGQQVLQGIQLAVNQSGLKNRQKLELVVKDSASGRPVTEILEELAADPNVVAVVGPVQSGEVKDIAPLVDRYKLPVITPTASADGLTQLSPYIFRNALTRDIQARHIADYSFNKLNLRRFAVLYPQEAFGIELKQHFEKEIRALGGEIVASVPYDRAQTDFKPQILELGGVSDDQLLKMTRDQLQSEEGMERFKQKGGLSQPVIEMGLFTEEDIEDLQASLELSYDAIFMPGFYDKVGLIIPQLVFYNIEDIVLLGANGWNSPQLLEIAGNYLKTGFFVDGFFADSKKPKVQKFVNAFKSNFGGAPGLYSAQAYDGAQILIEMIKKGAQNRLQIAEQLQSLRNYPGVSGQTSISSSGDSEKQLFTLQVQNRKISQVD